MMSELLYLLTNEDVLHFLSIVFGIPLVIILVMLLLWAFLLRWIFRINYIVELLERQTKILANVSKNLMDGRKPDNPSL